MEHKPQPLEARYSALEQLISGQYQPVKCGEYSFCKSRSAFSILETAPLRNSYSMDRASAPSYAPTLAQHNTTATAPRSSSAVKMLSISAQGRKYRGRSQLDAADSRSYIRRYQHNGTAN